MGIVKHTAYNTVKDLEIYYAIEILKGNIKIEHNKSDDKIIGGYYEMGISDNFINSTNWNRNGNKRLFKCKGDR